MGIQINLSEIIKKKQKTQIKGFLMTHGCNYDWKSADLCGGNGDGRAWKEFENWVDTNNIDIE